LQLKISRKNTDNVVISQTVATAIPTGTSKSAVLSKFLDAKSGLVVLDETPWISLYFLNTANTAAGVLRRTNSYPYMTSQEGEPL
jgi:hypothetical protein